MSSAPATSTSTEPTRELTTTVPPSAMPRAARSSGCMSSWWRARPLVSRVVLCSHELQSRWWRRPMSTSASSARGVASASSSQPRRRSRSPTRSVGTRSTRWSAVCRRPGIVGASGPRSTPSGCSTTSAAVVRPPVSSSSSTRSAGEAASWPAASSPSGSPSRSAIRVARPPKISQSWRWSSPRSKTAGVHRALLRTAKPWNTRSYWSRSSALVGGSTTSACRVVSLR